MIWEPRKEVNGYENSTLAAEPFFRLVAFVVLKTDSAWPE